MVAPTFFSRKGGGSSVMKEYEMISLKYNGRACRLYLLFFCAPEDIILSAIRPGSTKFEGKYFFNLQADPIERLTACVLAAKTKLNYSAYQTKFDTKMTRMKWNCTANMIMSVSVTVCHLILYFPVRAGVINQFDMASSQKWTTHVLWTFWSLFDIISRSVDLFFYYLYLLLTIYTYKLLKSFPHKASEQQAIFNYWRWVQLFKKNITNLWGGR